MAQAISGMTMQQMLPMATMAASGGMQAISAVGQGKHANAAAQMEAENYERQARNRMFLESQQEDRLRTNARHVIGKQLAVGAQSGVGLTGSRLDLLRESYNNMESDVADMRTDALLDYTGLNNQASVSRWEGEQAAKAGKINAVSTALTTVGNIGTYLGGLKTEKPEVPKAGKAKQFKPNSITEGLMGSSKNIAKVNAPSSTGGATGGGILQAIQGIGNVAQSAAGAMSSSMLGQSQKYGKQVPRGVKAISTKRYYSTSKSLAGKSTQGGKAYNKKWP